MEILSIIISLVSGIAGGNIAGALLSEKSLGIIGNSLAGIFGGGIGWWILQALGIISPEIVGAQGEIDIASLLANIGSSGVGGGILLFIVSLIKGFFE